MTENPHNIGISRLNGDGGNGVDSSAAVPVPASDVKRPPGRLLGSKKTLGSGRKKGTPNRASETGRQFIINRGRPLPLLCDLAAGRQISVADPENPKKKIKIYPDLKERRAAAAILAPMVVPTLKSTDFSFAVDDNPSNNLNFTVKLVPPIRRAEDD